MINARYVPKFPVPVRVAQPGYDPIDGYFALAPQSDMRPDGECVLELLNGAPRVVPLIMEENGRVILLTRLNIDWVMARGDAPMSLMIQSHGGPWREEAAEFHFVNGTMIDGLMQIGPGTDGARASDFLNDGKDFYPVRTRLGLLLVNKTRVRETRLSASPKHGTPDRSSGFGAAGRA